MKYFSISTVESAYKNISSRTNNKFWGILAITSSVDSIIAPQRVYALDVDNVSNLLEKQFCLVESPKVYSRGTQWNVIFSKNWAEYISQKLLRYSPNIYDVLVWYFRREVFEDDITKQKLVAKFLEETNISTEFAKQLFAFDDRQLDYSSDKYGESKLLASLNVICNNSTTYTTVTAEKSFVAANAGELSRAPFVQTLYAGQGAQECMILTQFDFNEYYGNVVQKRKVSLNDKEQGLDALNDSQAQILNALRTKPFLLLAGISGTGKSRIVRELAFKSCPEFLRDADGTTPGNYCMIEVKPNWHDSSELLGYYSHISKEYQYTNFIKFLVKAMMFPDVPFFVCLDEMNLAPVEQYFAEFLSVLETRKKVGDRIHTGALVKPEYFKELQNAEGGDGYIFTQWFPEIKRNIPYNIYTNPTLAQVGLTLPDNVFIIGTVNMDDTTHQFSRKVLDRAMTIEMNGGKLSDMFGQSHNLEYLPEEDIWDVNKFIPEYVTADEVIAVNPDTAEELKTKLPERLEEINEVLKDTPFVVSYRVLNELVIYTGNLLNDGKSIDEAIDEAVNQIVLMKILPRIEGDEDMFIVKGAAENRLERLAHLVSGATKAKLEEMNNRLSTGFTRFWP